MQLLTLKGSKFSISVLLRVCFKLDFGEQEAVKIYPTVYLRCIIPVVCVTNEREEKYTVEQHN